MVTYYVEADLLTTSPLYGDVCRWLEAQFPPDAGAAAGQSQYGTHAVAISLAVAAADAAEAELQADELIANALYRVGLVAVELLGRMVVRWDLSEVEQPEPQGYSGIVNAAEVADILGVSKRRVSQLVLEHRGFPEPLYHLRGAGSLWVRADVEEFARRWHPGTSPPGAESAAG
jgi:predicted DNA-binding transcriptional regulator AlpA